MRITRRRQYLTNKRYQFRSLGMFLTLVFFAVIVSVFSTHYFILSAVVNEMEQSGKYITAERYFSITIKPLFIIVPVILVLFSLYAIFYSHRTAGALHRLKQCFKMVEQGEFPDKLEFRKYDEIRDIAESFNDMVEGLKKRCGDKDDCLKV
ncbi:MAG: hypothetical protein SWO11_00930 [Thermodesulfobacteriota bacterium]|nr:hypothetical protein [Thermodesulfobacteriota bacterium]